MKEGKKAHQGEFKSAGQDCRALFVISCLAKFPIVEDKLNLTSEAIIVNNIEFGLQSEPGCLSD